MDIYRSSQVFPIEERFGLQSQLRRAAVSVASNIVEGCARRHPREYRSFLNIATGSSAEALYLLTIAVRLGLLSATDSERLSQGYAELTAALKSLLRALEQRAD